MLHQLNLCKNKGKPSPACYLQLQPGLYGESSIGVYTVKTGAPKCPSKTWITIHQLLFCFSETVVHSIHPLSILQSRRDR